MSEETNWDLCDFINEGGRHWTWTNIARWTAHLLDGAKWEDVSRMPIERRAGLLRRIVGLNLKKVPDASGSDMTVIHRFATEDAPFIREQISIYRPHLIVACGNFPIIKQIFDLKLGSRIHYEEGYFHSDPERLGVLLHFWHPQARIAPSKLFESFGLAISAIRKADLFPPHSS